MWKLNGSLWYLGVYCYYFSFSELDDLLNAFNHLSGRKEPLVLFGVAPFSLGQYKSIRVFPSLEHLRKGSLIICPPGHHLYGPLEANNSNGPIEAWARGMLQRLETLGPSTQSSWVFHSQPYSRGVLISVTARPADTGLCHRKGIPQNSL